MQIDGHKSFDDSFARSPLHCYPRRPQGGRRGDTPPPSGRCAPPWPGPGIGQHIITLQCHWSGQHLALSGQAPCLDDGLPDGLRPDPARLPHQGDLRRGLDHPHVMKDRPEDCRSNKIFSSLNFHHSPRRFNKVDIFHFLQKVEDSFVSVRIPRLKVIIPNVEL